MDGQPHRYVLAAALVVVLTLTAACGARSAATLHHASGPATPVAPSLTTSSMATPSTAVPPPVAAHLPVITVLPPPSTTTTAPPCPPTLAGQLASTGNATQLITVDAPGYGSTTATVALWQRAGTGCWTEVAGPWSGWVGHNGVSDHHREGDGTTPTGSYTIGPVMYGVALNPGIHYQYHQLVCGDWWDEDPASPQYNTFQHVACDTKPSFGGNSEALWTETDAYQHFAVVDYNTNPVVPDAGSAVFVHDDTGGPTDGCVSLPPAQLDTLLRWLQPGQSPLIVIGTDAEIRHF